MEKQKSVTIKETLFMDLVKYFLVNVREDEDRIRLELQKKLDVLVKRELYTKYKTAKSAMVLCQDLAQIKMRSSAS